MGHLVGWCLTRLTSGAGPPTPPAPAMTSPVRASIWSSLLQRPAVLHAGEAAMWWWTCARLRLRNRPRLESMLVEVQCSQMKRDTPSLPPPHQSPPPVACGPAPAFDMNVTTATNSVGTMDIIAYLATIALDPWHERGPSLCRGSYIQCIGNRLECPWIGRYIQKY